MSFKKSSNKAGLRLFSGIEYEADSGTRVSSELGIELNKGTEDNTGEGTSVGDELDKYKLIACWVGWSRLCVDSGKYNGVDITGVRVVLNGSDVYRMGVELCTFIGEDVVGYEFVDSNEVGVDDEARVGLELGKVIRLFIYEVDGVILERGNFNNTDWVRTVSNNGNGVCVEDNANVAAVLVKRDVVDLVSCSGVEVEMGESNDVVVDCWVRFEFDEDSDA